MLYLFSHSPILEFLETNSLKDFILLLVWVKWISCLCTLWGCSSSTLYASFIHMFPCLPITFLSSHLQQTVLERDKGTKLKYCFCPNLGVPSHLEPMSGLFALHVMESRNGNAGTKRCSPFLPCVSEICVSGTWQSWLQSLLLCFHPQGGIQVTL